MTITDETIDGWLSGLAARTPTPGGGSAAALCAATAAALAGMVAVYTMGERWADRAEHMAELTADAARLRERALAAADADVAAFGAVSAAYGLPRQTGEQKAARTQEIQRALIRAAGPPAEVGRLAVQVIGIASDLATSGNPNVLSDVAVAASVARAALEGAIVNIEVNRGLIRDEGEAVRLDAIIEELGTSLSAADRVVRTVRGRLAP